MQMKPTDFPMRICIAALTIFVMIAILTQSTLDALHPSRQQADAALMLAAEAGDADGVRAALDRGASVEARDALGMSPLIAASFAGNVEAVRLLLDRGAPTDPLRRRDDVDRTALMLAAYAGREQVVRELLKRGADPNARSSRGKTALSMAVYRTDDPCCAACVRLLLDAGTVRFPDD